MNVGILGTRWGRTHVGTFRAAGCRIEAIVGRDPARSAAIAAAEQVPRSDLAALDDVDLVVIATPFHAHRELVRRWAPHKAVWCEKPYVADTVGPRIGVNYAFPFLDAARRLPVHLATAAAVEVSAGDGGLAVRREIAVHPLSWLHVALGPVAVRDGELVAGDLPVSLAVGPADRGQIVIRVALAGAGTLEGRFEPGAGWTWGDGVPEPWYRANCAAAAAFVEVLRGAPPPPGLFDAATAVAFETALTPWFGTT